MSSPLQPVAKLVAKLNFGRGLHVGAAKFPDEFQALNLEIHNIKHLHVASCRYLVTSFPYFRDTDIDTVFFGGNPAPPGTYIYIYKLFINLVKTVINYQPQLGSVRRISSIKSRA